MTGIKQILVQQKRNKVSDVELFEKYRGKYVFFEISDYPKTHLGKLSQVGENLVYFTELELCKSKRTDATYNILNLLDEENPERLEEIVNEFKQLPNQTFNKTTIEKIALAKDVLKILKSKKY